VAVPAGIEMAEGGMERLRLDEALAQAARLGCPPAVVAGDLTLVRPLGWYGIPVVAVTADPEDVTLRSRYVAGHCLVPGFSRLHEHATVRALAELGQRLAQALGRKVPLLYGQDCQLELLYRNREALEEHFLFVLNDDTLGWSLHDKGRFFPLCEAAGVRAPHTVVPAEREDHERALLQLRPPLVVKPREKASWKQIQDALMDGKGKARVFPDARALLGHPAWPTLKDQLVVQEYIDAPVTELSSFHGFAARDGRLLASFCGRKLRTYPAVAGESTLLELVLDPEIEAAGRAVVEKLGVRGPFKVDLIRDPRNRQIYTLEVNARFNLWHHLGAAHGVNLPLVAYEYLVDDYTPPKPPAYQPRARWVNFYNDVRAFREDAALGTGTWLSSLMFSRTVHEVFAWDDLRPWVAWMAGMVRARMRRRA
jgi:predicted ATP-grasp superfamily ATP-dependent carboligase